MKYKIIVSSQLISRFFCDGKYDYTIKEGLPEGTKLVDIIIDNTPPFYDHVIFVFSDGKEDEKEINPQIVSRDAWSNWMAKERANDPTE